VHTIHARIGAVIAAALFIAGCASAARADTIEARHSFRQGDVDEIRVVDRRSTAGIVIRSSIDTEIELSQGASDEIEIVMSGEVRSNRRRCMPTLEVDESRGTVEAVVTLCNGPVFFLNLSGELRIEVSVPRDWQGDYFVDGSSASVVIGDATLARVGVDLSSGSTRIGRLRADDVEIESSSGVVDVESIEADTVTIGTSSGLTEIGELLARETTIDTSSGGATVDAVAGNVEADLSSGLLSIDFGGRRGSARVNSSSGGVEILGIDGSVTVDVSSGTITVDFARIREDSRIEASSGDVRLTLPSSANLDVDLETSSGGIRVDFPVTVEGAMDDDELRGRIGSGGPTLEVDTSSGRIVVSPRS
jgi:hypothetical protein